MAETVRIPGAVDGFSTTDKDGVVDAALVIPTLSASSVFRFDLESLLAPDERAKAGPISADVPGNTYIPRQKEKYGFLTVTLEKDEFGFYTQAGEENELSALWFSAPWDLLIEASKGNVNMTALLKAAKFRKAGFAGLKDWSRERKINLSLDRELRAQGSIKWTRGAAPKDYGDMVVVFQSTPSGRWALSGFDGNPAETTPFSTFDGFPQRVKVLGVRSKFAEDGNVLAAEGWIVDADRRSKITFTGVPAPLKGGAIVGKNVHWLNPGGPGWMGVMHQVQVPKVADAPLPSLFDGIFPFSKFLPNNTAEASVTWVDPTLETAPLPATYKAGDRLMLVLVGTSREVSAPRDGEQEPELFTYAQSLRSVVVK
ncbi:MAG TPA: hypothetical protein VM901_04200 [Bdellovibrionota bacterium]|jgi:hypothetical protein|nr:hypothetical protein [Bdellovibrionota bacterium]